MSLRRITILLGREISAGLTNIIVIMVLVVPLVFTLIINLLFGTIFTGQARLGVADLGDSQLVALAEQRASLDVERFANEAELREAVAAGAVDVGVALPERFDRRVHNGRAVELTAFTWGESTLSNRVIIGTALGTFVREIAGQELPVEVVTVILGDGEGLSWEERLLPFIVLVTVVLGGTMVPATSLVEEKQKRTLQAVTITPATVSDVLASKALLGIILSTVMGTVTLVLNRAFGNEPALLVLVLVMGAVFAALLGILLGSFVKDINTLFTITKAGGLLLYAPALIYLFPQIPQWIGRIFPTYYMIDPVVQVTQHGATLADVWPELAILSLLIVVLIGAVAFVVNRATRYEGTLNIA